MSYIQIDGIEHLLELHRGHQAWALPGQRSLNRVTRALSRPTAVGVAILVMAAWIGGNLFAARSHWRPLDTIPFLSSAWRWESSRSSWRCSSSARGDTTKSWPRDALT